MTYQRLTSFIRQRLLYKPVTGPNHFLESFPDVTMDVVHMVADGYTVVARLRCSGTHLGVWRGHPPTGRRFERVDEVYFFSFLNGKVNGSWGVEDNLKRFRQLGLAPW